MGQQKGNQLGIVRFRTGFILSVGGRWVRICVLKNLVTGKGYGKPTATSTEEPLLQHSLEVCCVLEAHTSSSNDVDLGGRLL